ncbi:hypothetical protein JCM15765_30610 [Paradesulfitobacterium aromaticivorans]
MISHILLQSLLKEPILHEIFVNSGGIFSKRIECFTVEISEGFEDSLKVVDLTTFVLVGWHMEEDDEFCW